MFLKENNAFGPHLIMLAEVIYGNYDGLRRPRVYAEWRAGWWSAWRVDAEAGRSEAVVVILPPCRSAGGGGDGSGRRQCVAGRGRAGEELRGCKQCLTASCGTAAGACVWRFSVSIRDEGDHYFGQDKWLPRWTAQ